ncbi:MAG: glycosyltransferase family 39 protein [Chitinophagales bacterium]|nr:glycosyltransferase family 39 protein [Chitinophagales bacterium]
MKLKIISILAFIMLFVALFFAYDYYKIIHLKPNGTHTWRQMDGASMALTYYQHHRPFLKPQIHNLFNGDGQTIGELPITYYTASKLYTLFGYKDVWFRLLQLVIYFIGTFALYKTALLLFENVFYSLVLTVIALASPVVNFYALNFMPDVPALSSMYVAIYFFVKYVKTHKNSSFYLSLFMAILAGLLKITALIPLCVLFGVFFINQVLRQEKMVIFF